MMSDNTGNTTEQNGADTDRYKRLRESKISPEAEYGYFYFPDRKGKEWTIWQTLNPFNFYARHHVKCEKNLKNAIENPYIKILLKAMKAHGCEAKLNRHMVCEKCLYPVQGGFDPKANQVVLCQNICKSPQKVQHVLGHELTHMFDYCRANLDFKNLEHLACTEIRAANFFHCAYMGSWIAGECTMWNYGKAHQKCVRRKARDSVMAVRDVSHEEADIIIDKVFDRCYNDFEPFGRRIRSLRSADIALIDGNVIQFRPDLANGENMKETSSSST